jgi:hypothetical protein
MSLIHTLPQQIWTAAMALVAGLSLWRGGWAERTVALGMVVSSIATALFQNTHDWSAPQWGDLTVDAIYLALLLGVALRSKRLWPLFAAAFQLIAVVVYAARIVDSRVGARSPFTAGVIWSYLILVSVVVGLWLHRHSRSTAGRSTSPSPSIGTSAT